LLTIGTVVVGPAVFLLLSFALLPLLEPLRLLIVLAVHLFQLLLLAALELILPMLIGVLAAHSLLFLIMPLLHPLAFGILLLAHSVEFLLVFLLQRRIPGRAVGRPIAARTVGESAPATVRRSHWIAGTAPVAFELSVRTIRLSAVVRAVAVGFSVFLALLAFLQLL